MKQNGESFEDVLFEEEQKQTYLLPPKPLFSFTFLSR